MTDSPAKPRLLIVDDEIEVRGVLHDLLCGAYECAEASSAEEALAQLRNHVFDLVISDITMSGMSGLEMIPHVKTVSPDTVIVARRKLPLRARLNITNWSSQRSVMKLVWKNWSSNVPQNWIKRWIRSSGLIAQPCKR